MVLRWITNQLNQKRTLFEAFVGWSQASTNSSVDTASFEEHVKKYVHTNEVFEFGLTLVVLIFRRIG